MARIDADTLYGTLNLLILQTLARDRLHGLEIQSRIHGLAQDALRIEEGALYPALHRLERDGLLEAEWSVSTKGRRAKFYRLTVEGRRRLLRETEGWMRHVEAVMRVLHLDGGVIRSASARAAHLPDGRPA